MMLRAFARCAFAFGLLVPAAAQPAAAQARQAADSVHTVRYSYQKWSRTGDTRYVLMPVATAIKAGALPERIRAVFKELLRSKRNSYGDARLAFKANADQTGLVFVYLDEAKKAYHPIVMAETVYSFTENGATSVKFPKVADQGWTRDDVPFAAYVITVPLWQALPPAKFAGSLVKLPDGTLLPSDTAVERLRKGDKVVVEGMWSYLKSGPAAAALATVKAAGLLKVGNLEKRLLPLLQSANAGLRGAALGGLAGRDNRNVNKVLRAMMDGDPDPKLRDQAAGLLSRSKDPNFAAAAQFHALRSQDATVVAAAALALGDSRSKEATAQLLEKLGHTSAGVREAVVNSLLKRRAYKQMVASLGAQSLAAVARLEVARALATATPNKPSTLAALLYLVKSGKGDDSVGAAAKLVAYDSPATYEALGRALQHAEGATRRAAAAALSRLGHVRALPLLAGANITDPESGNAVVTAIRTIYSKQNLQFVLKGSRDPNAVLRRAAVATLGVKVKQKDGKRHQKTIIETLRSLRGDPDALIRAAVASSFEVMASDGVRADIEALAGDDATEVKRAVAHALRAFPGPKTTTFLLRYLAERDPWVIAYASESVGLLKERQALNAILPHLEHKDAFVRRAATDGLLGIGGTLEGNERKRLMALFNPLLFDKDQQVRMKAVNGLKLINDQRVIIAAAPLIQDPVADIRKATLTLMAETGHPSAVEAIATALEDDDPTVRRSAIQALLSLKRKEAVGVLADYAKKEQDQELSNAALRAIATLKGG